MTNMDSTGNPQGTKRAGVVGWPVSHSLSPTLHGYWLKHLGIAGSYEAVSVEPGRFATAAERLLEDEGWRGFNVTIPHKEDAFRFCDQHDSAASRLGAVNTVVILPDGAIEGRNTDLHGFMANLEASEAWPSVRKDHAVVLGAGGAARAVLAALHDWSFRKITLVNRTLDRAFKLIEELSLSQVQVVSWDRMEECLNGTNLLINSTSLGMTGQPPLQLDMNAVPTEAMVTDIVYAPLETDLLAAARACGNPVVDGLGMLLHQAAPGFQAWFDTQSLPEVDAALRDHVLAAREALHR